MTPTTAELAVTTEVAAATTVMTDKAGGQSVNIIDIRLLNHHTQSHAITRMARHRLTSAGYIGGDISGGDTKYKRGEKGSYRRQTEAATRAEDGIPPVNTQTDCQAERIRRVGVCATPAVCGICEVADTRGTCQIAPQSAVSTI